MLLGALLLASAGAGAEPVAGRATAPSADPAATTLLVGVRSGSHAGFGRVVLDLPSQTNAEVVRSPGAAVVRVTLRGTVPVGFAPLPVPPRNAQSISLVDGALRVVTAPGVAIRQARLPGRLVLDLLDAEARPSAPAELVKPAGRPGDARVEQTSRPPPDSDGAIADLPGTERRGHRGPSQAPTAASGSALPAPVEAVPLAAPNSDPPGLQASAAADATSAPHGEPSRPAAAAVPPPMPAAPAVLPVPDWAGLAALRRGEFGLLVVDARGPADPAAWRRVPGLAEAEIQDLPGATLVSFKLLPAITPLLTRDAAGWTLDLVGGAGAGSAAVDPAPLGTGTGTGIALSAGPDPLLLAVEGASRVVSVADPLGGGMLLVGTLLADKAPAGATGAGATGAGATRAGATGAGDTRAGATRIVSSRLLPSMALLPTWRGVAVEPLSDLLDMRADAHGFLLDLGPQRTIVGALPPGGVAQAAATGMRLRFDLPPLSIDALANREQAAAGAAAAAAPRARGAAQLRLAESMVALGLGAEAQAVLRLGLAADGRLAADPTAVALGGVAALLAGRLSDSGGLDDQPVREDVTGADEIALWRSLRVAAIAAASDTSDAAFPDAAVSDPALPDAARTIAARLAILLAYPPSLRDRVLPLAVETLAEGGQPRAAERAIAAAGSAPGLDYARALLEIGGGHTDAALVRLDRLAAGADRDLRARAAVRAVELRLAAGKLSVAAAADALDRLIAAWRGDGREVAVRMRVAGLRAQAGQFAASLALLRDTRDEGQAAQWPEKLRAMVRDQLASVFARTLAQDDAVPMPPLEFVSLIEDNADLLPGGVQGERVAARVADRLAALDLPERAAAALHRLMDAAPPGAARAALGARLAAMQMRQGDADAALVTLSASTAEALPAALVAERTLTYARASAARGDIDAAVGALAALDTQAADSLRTELLEKAGRWPEAAAALWRRAARDIPPNGALGPESVALVMRLASAAAQAGQSEGLDRLRTDELPPMPAGPDADMLRVLTEGPIRGVADLPRSAQEAALARSAVR